MLRSTAAMEILREIFSPMGFEEFEREYLFKKPCALPRTAMRFRKLIGWNLLFEIFESGHKNCWLAKAGKLSPDPRLNNGSLNLVQAKQGFEDGYTIVVRRSEQAHPKLNEIATEFQSHFKRPVDIQLYCTPEGERGFDWHYDMEEVFVIQSSGEKEFSLRKNSLAKPVSFSDLPKKMTLSDHMEGPEIKCLLKAGDILYIPSGFWHRAQALTPSFHLSVGVMFRSKLRR